MNHLLSPVNGKNVDEVLEIIIKINLEYKGIRPGEITKKDELVVENNFDEKNAIKINYMQVLTYIFPMFDWNDSKSKYARFEAFDCLRGVNIALKFNELDLLDHETYMDIITFLNYAMEMKQKSYDPYYALSIRY